MYSQPLLQVILIFSKQITTISSSKSMAPKRFPIVSQDDFLYDGLWKSNVDALFIDCLLFEARQGNFKRGAPNVEAIMYGQSVIKRQFGLEFSYGYCMSKVAKLEERFSTFAWVLDQPGVVYDPKHNTISCPSSYWDFIVKENTFALAYRHFGDPAWEHLKEIFDRVPNFEDYGNNEVIVVSSEDSGDENAARKGKKSAAEDPPLDVHQAALEKSKRVQKQLWHYWPYATDTYSEGSLNTEASTANSRTPPSAPTGKNEDTRFPAPNFGLRKPNFSKWSCSGSNDFI